MMLEGENTLQLLLFIDVHLFSTSMLVYPRVTNNFDGVIGSLQTAYCRYIKVQGVSGYHLPMIGWSNPVSRSKTGIFPTNMSFVGLLIRSLEQRAKYH